MRIKLLRHNDECPKCGDTPFLGKIKYCWSSLNSKCPVWHTYGGEHLHRTCYTCGYIWPVYPKDALESEKTQEEQDTEFQKWIDEKINELPTPDFEPPGEITLLDQAEEDPEQRRIDLP